MATSPQKAEAGLPPETGVAVATPPPPVPGTEPKCVPDALQALLAFSSLHEQVRQRRTRETAESETSPGNSSDEFVLYEVLQLVAVRALALTGADGVAIALVQGGEIICRAATGLIAPDIGARLDPHAGFSGLCLSSGEVVRCDDAENDARVNIQASRKLHARSMVAVPLKGRRTVIGLLEAFSTEAYGFNDSDVRSLNLLAELILGAMKPEEGERLEALSPVAIHLPAVSEPKTPGDANLFPAPEISSTEELSRPEPARATAREQVSSALSIESHIENHPPASDRRTSLLVALLVLLALLAGGGIYLALHSRPAPAASTATKPLAVAQPAAATAKPASEPVPTAAPTPDPSAVQEDAARGVLPLVTGIRYWESGDSTTVVIDLQDQVQYEVHRLSSPERIYFDLHDAVLSPGLSGKTIHVGESLLLRIRAAEPVPGIARIVLETKDASNFSVSLEQNPYRLVAEIRSLASDKSPRSLLDFVHPKTPPEPYKLAVLGNLSKEDLQLRARVPHLKIVLDAGHGGWDLGTAGRSGLLEKDLVLDVTQRLGVLLQSRIGSDVVFTREDDVFLPLEQRAGIANEAQADLFVSVHANYSDYPTARGVETYYTNVSAPTNSTEIEKRENATARDPFATSALTGVALKERTQESRRLAASVERALYGTLASANPGIRDRGVKEAGFVVLTGTSMPAILAEISFVSSPEDESKLQSPKYRQSIAEALYKGIARYAASTPRVKLASTTARVGGN